MIVLDEVDPSIVSAILTWLYTHDPEVLMKRDLRNLNEVHKSTNVEYIFDIIKLAHNLEIPALLAQAYKLIEKRLKSVLPWAIGKDDVERSEALSIDDSEADLSNVLLRVSTLPTQVKSSCEHSITRAMDTCRCDWNSLLEIEILDDYIGENHHFASRVKKTLACKVDGLRVATCRC